MDLKGKRREIVVSFDLSEQFVDFRLRCVFYLKFDALCESLAFFYRHLIFCLLRCVCGCMSSRVQVVLSVFLQVFVLLYSFRYLIAVWIYTEVDFSEKLLKW